MKKHVNKQRGHPILGMKKHVNTIYIMIMKVNEVIKKSFTFT